MQDKESPQYLMLQKYDGKFCRVFLSNGSCLVGNVKLVDDWIVIQHPNKQQCSIQLPYVISISEFEPR